MTSKLIIKEKSIAFRISLALLDYIPLTLTIISKLKAFIACNIRQLPNTNSQVFNLSSSHYISSASFAFMASLPMCILIHPNIK